MNVTLTELLNASATAWPERLAVSETSGERAITYRDLDVLAAELGAELLRLGVSKGDVVAIVCDNCIEYALALFAILEAGGCAAPLNPQLAPSQLTSRLGQLRARAAIVPAHLEDMLSDTIASNGLPVWKLLVAGGRPELTGKANDGAGDAPRRVGRDLAIALLTSGTTAAPKIVPLTHSNVLTAITGIREAYRLGAHDRTLLVMPLYHGHGLVAGLLATLSAGGAAFVPAGGRFHAHAFWSEMAAARATWYTAVPTIHQILLARAGNDFPSGEHPNLRFIRSCSAPLAPAVLADLEATFAAPVLEAYGMTETAHQIASNPLPSVGLRKPGSVGIATNARLQVTRPDGRPAATGETGEIWVRGAGVTSGYLDNADANAESFTSGWFHTGDLGQMDTVGYLFLTGRIKEIINRGGEKISPAAVDAVLEGNPNVEEALSFAVPDEHYGEEIYAAVVTRPGHAISESDLQNYSRARLSAYELPKRIFFVAELPRTDKGAGDRRRMAELARQEGVH